MVGATTVKLFESVTETPTGKLPVEVDGWQDIDERSTLGHSVGNPVQT